MPIKTEKPSSPDGGRVALAMFALLAAEREERVFDIAPRSVEVILGGIGFTPAEVQSLTGVNRKTVASRMKKRKSS